MNSASLKPLQMIGVSVVGQGDDRQQLRLAARLQAEPVAAARTRSDLLHHLPLLVDLDRVDAAILAPVAVLLHRRGEGGVDLPEPVLEDLGEPQQDRQVDAPHLEPVDELLQVDAPGRILVGMDSR